VTQDRPPDVGSASAPTMDSVDPMEALARDVLPALIARLGSSGLGELEVATDAWRVRLRRSPSVAAVAGNAAVGGDSERDAGPPAARSPGVGYFDPDPGFAVGASVAKGDRLGSVEVLGVAQEVISPADGVIGRVHAESGQAVEFGQRLATIGASVGTADEAGGTAAEVDRVSD
jgi:biotin carboxyl carrier protein